MAFDTIYVHRSVSKAAATLDVPQPTLSRRLAKLRESFSDPLFIRTRHGMEPTPIGMSLAEPIKEIVRLYETKLLHAGGFTPISSSRTFRIAASDLGHLLILPPLLRLAAREAPNLRFVAVPLEHRPMIERLESGEVDLAIGGFPNLYAGVLERTLFTDAYVCLVRHDHPSIQTEITLENFRRASHIIVSSHLLGHIHQQVEKQLLETCPPSNVKVVSESFLLSGLLVEKTDLVLVVPNRVASLLSDRIGTLRRLSPLSNFFPLK